MTTRFEKQVQKARETALTALSNLGIADSFTVKIRKFPKNSGHAIGMYRAMTQFRGHSVPIFWINKDLPKIAKEEGVANKLQTILEDTLLHEYAHVVWEFCIKNGGELWAQLMDLSFNDEEDFAEATAFALQGRYPDARIDKLLRAYAAELNPGCVCADAA